MSHALEKVAKEVGLDPDLGIPAVAIAYVMQKTPYVFPIVGGRKVEHLMANIEALKISLSDEQIKYLESLLPFEPGFPHNVFVCDVMIHLCGLENSIADFLLEQGTAEDNNALFKSAGNFDKWPLQQAIRPQQ